MCILKREHSVLVPWSILIALIIVRIASTGRSEPQLNILNMLHLDPPGQCHPEAHPKCLLCSQNCARKNQKRSKTAKNCQKKWFFSSKFPPQKMFFTPFLLSSILLARGRQTLVEDDLWWKTSFGGLGWAVLHSDFLIDTKNIETQRIFGFKTIWTKFFTA